MTSGAYHDAMILAARVPVGMLFVPERGGISHHPDEYTRPRTSTPASTCWPGRSGAWRAWAQNPSR